jgi:hypothetical protein
MTLPVNSQNVDVWLLVAPNIQYFNSKENFFVRFFEKRKKLLMKASDDCDAFIDHYTNEYRQIPDLGVTYM